MKVRFAVSLGAGVPDAAGLAAVVEAAEDSGFDSVWLSDLPTMPATDPLLGAVFAAARTRRVHVGINFIPFGSAPYLVAHRLAQADRLTGGRLLVTLVPGLDRETERGAIGTAGRHRGRMMDDLVPQLRRWWSGGGEPPLPARPVQEPLELWLGGAGPESIERAGRLADGWLGAFLPPAEAGRVRAGIEQAAAAAGRRIDPEHFGMSIGYARREEDRGLGRRGPVPVGAEELTELCQQLIASGLSKFVVRPAGAVVDWDEELDWLAGVLLPLQT